MTGESIENKFLLFWDTLMQTQVFPASIGHLEALRNSWTLYRVISELIRRRFSAGFHANMWGSNPLAASHRALQECADGCCMERHGDLAIQQCINGTGYPVAY